MSPQALTKDLERKARIFALIGDPTRIRILSLLSKKGKVKVSDIARQVHMGMACVSHHLQLLKDNRLVASTRRGNSIFYRLTDNPFINNLISLIK